MAQDDKDRVDVGDEAQVKKRKSKAKLAEERRSESFRWLLQDRRGREVVFDFLKEMGLFDTLAFVDVQHMSIRVGRREAALWWKERMDSVDPNAFILMQYEALNREDDNG